MSTSAEALSGTKEVPSTGVDPAAAFRDAASKVPTEVKLPKTPASPVKVNQETQYGAGSSTTLSPNRVAESDVTAVEKRTTVSAPLGPDTTLNITNQERQLNGETVTSTTNPRTGAVRTTTTPIDQTVDATTIGITQNLTPDKKANPQVTVTGDYRRQTSDNNVTGVTTESDRFRLSSDQTFKLGTDASLRLRESASFQTARPDGQATQDSVELSGSARLTVTPFGKDAGTTLFGEVGVTQNTRVDGNVPANQDRTTNGSYYQLGIGQKIGTDVNVDLTYTNGNAPNLNPLSPGGVGDGKNESLRFNVKVTTP